uniref:Uncharacterized protein n=1 Tax=Arundo donax TaxID=35708 RepID=A0A0A9HB47_ARUDO
MLDEATLAKAKGAELALAVAEHGKDTCFSFLLSSSALALATSAHT